MMWIWILLGTASFFGIVLSWVVWTIRNNRSPLWFFPMLLLALIPAILCFLMAKPVLSSTPSLWSQALEQKCTWEVRK